MRQQRGFSLIETLTATAVAATLATAAVPSMSHMLARQQVGHAVNELLLAIDLGRSEAVARGTRVVLAPKVAQDWSSGWVLYRDVNDNGVREDGEPIVREFDRPSPRIQFTTYGMVRSATMSFEETGLIRRAGSNGLMLGRMNIVLEEHIRTVCFGAARVRVVSDQLTCT